MNVVTIKSTLSSSVKLVANVVGMWMRWKYHIKSATNI